ncbi:hypothetical protein F3Y22_tig00116989pilonHSYRG00103 [Hibiscus syriacus]|uniref:Uncharacterized protein n=1 Tax=Hibiscus syriacus TaxID=106335 RepID=A0A6A2WHI8_HIBSY|nr:hypothetical protein F3Y22_tig00116989pilonHSYRG00103 [Hibiscus syriacus]
MHCRNKKAMELIAKGWSALKEVDRVIDYCELNDKRLVSLLRENFELALEADNSNAHARMSMFNPISQLSIIWRKQLGRCSLPSRHGVLDRGLREERRCFSIMVIPQGI